VEACGLILDGLRANQAPTGKLFSLVPHFVRLLETLGDAAGGFDGVHGTAYRDYLLDRICASKWHPEICVALANAFVYVHEFAEGDLLMYVEISP